MMRPTALGQGRDRERHREVRLAGAGGADREGDGVVADGVHVALLRHRLRRDLLAAMPPYDVLEDLAEVARLVERAHDRADRVRADVVAALDQLDELADDGAGLRHLLLLALEGEHVAAQADRAVQALAQRVEDAVSDARELRPRPRWRREVSLPLASV